MLLISQRPSKLSGVRAPTLEVQVVLLEELLDLAPGNLDLDDVLLDVLVPVEDVEDDARVAVHEQLHLQVLEVFGAHDLAVALAAALRNEAADLLELLLDVLQVRGDREVDLLGLLAEVLLRSLGLGLGLELDAHLLRVARVGRLRVEEPRGFVRRVPLEPLLAQLHEAVRVGAQVLALAQTVLADAGQVDQDGLLHLQPRVRGLVLRLQVVLLVLGDVLEELGADLVLVDRGDQPADVGVAALEVLHLLPVGEGNVW